MIQPINESEKNRIINLHRKHFVLNEGMYINDKGELMDDSDDTPVDKSYRDVNGTEIVDVLIYVGTNEFMFPGHYGEAAVIKWFDDSDDEGEGVIVRERIEEEGSVETLHMKGKLKWNDKYDIHNFYPYYPESEEPAPLNEEEDKSVIKSLAGKINGIIKSQLRIEDLVSNQKLIFGIRRVDGRFTMISPTAAKDFKGMGPFDGDSNRGKFQLNGKMLFLTTPSAGYVDMVETNLNDEEKLNFEKEGFIPSFPNKSLKNLIKDGTINIILKGGGQSFMSYEKAFNQTQLNQFCRSLTKFDNLGDEVPVEDILLTDTASGKKKICYGPYKGESK